MRRVGVQAIRCESVIGIRYVGHHLALVAIVAVSAIACSESTPDQPAPALSTPACAPNAPAESVFTSEKRPDLFTIQVPRLAGWTQQQADPTSPAFVLSRFDPPAGDDITLPATITVAAFSPTSTTDAAFKNLNTLRPTGPNWQQSRHEDVEVCGQHGIRITGTSPDPNLNLHHDFLDLAYVFKEKTYPIQIAAQTRTDDLPRYAADLETILSSVQILP